MEPDLTRSSELTPIGPLQQVLAALADPVRLEMVRRLARSGHDTLACSALYDNISKSTASHHFRTLREAGITQRVVEDGQTQQRLRSRDVETAYPGVLSAILKSAG